MIVGEAYCQLLDALMVPDLDHGADLVTTGSSHRLP